MFLNVYMTDNFSILEPVNKDRTKKTIRTLHKVETFVVLCYKSKANN